MAVEMMVRDVLFVTSVFLLGSLRDGRGLAARLCLFRLFFFHFLPKQKDDVSVHRPLLAFRRRFNVAVNLRRKADFHLGVCMGHISTSLWSQWTTKTNHIWGIDATENVVHGPFYGCQRPTDENTTSSLSQGAD